MKYGTQTMLLHLTVYQAVLSHCSAKWLFIIVKKSEVLSPHCTQLKHSNN